MLMDYKCKERNSTECKNSMLLNQLKNKYI